MIDVDQAFEECSSSAVLPSLRKVSLLYFNKIGYATVLVRKGRKFNIVVERVYTRSLHSINLSVIAIALHASTSASVAALGPMVSAVLGFAIGGILPRVVFLLFFPRKSSHSKIIPSYIVSGFQPEFCK